MTIDKLIKLLEEAKEKYGGETSIDGFDQNEHDYELTDEIKIVQNSSNEFMNGRLAIHMIW